MLYIQTCRRKAARAVRMPVETANHLKPATNPITATKTASFEFWPRIQANRLGLSSSLLCGCLMLGPRGHEKISQQFRSKISPSTCVQLFVHASRSNFETACMRLDYWDCAVGQGQIESACTLFRKVIQRSLSVKSHSTSRFHPSARPKLYNYQCIRQSLSAQRRLAAFSTFLPALPAHMGIIMQREDLKTCFNISA